MKYFGVKNKVLQKLVENPETRDSDNLLIANIILETETEDLRRISAYDFIKKVKDGAYNFESIRRCRQKLQEKNEALRGNNWSKRHKFKEAVKNQLYMEF